MIAGLELAVSRGHAAARIALDRTPDDAPRVSRRLAVAVAVLTVPFVMALIVNAIGEYTHVYSPATLLPWLLGNGPGAGRLIALGPLVALIVVAAARLRFRVSRQTGRWTGSASARLDGWEIAIAGIALAVMAIFVGHLAADAFACDAGVTRAC
jgi:hypothetical protein